MKHTLPHTSEHFLLTIVYSGTKMKTLLGSLVYLCLIIGADFVSAQVKELKELVRAESALKDQESKNWLLDYFQTEYDLIAGNKHSFDEGLQKVYHVGAGTSLIKLYSWSVEAEFTYVDPRKYLTMLDAYRKEQERMKSLKRRGAAHFDDDQSRWYRANYYYITKNEKKLKSLIGLIHEGDDDSSYVDGYVELLLAKLLKSKVHAMEAIRHLESLVQLTITGIEPVDIRQGRIALHLGRSYLIAAMYTKDRSRKSEMLLSATGYASRARYGLEVQTVPIFHANALDLSADILDEKAALTPYAGAAPIWRKKADEMRILAIPFS